MNPGDDITVLNYCGNETKSRVPVEPGDVPGVFIRGSGVRIKFFNHLNIVYASSEPPTIITTDDEYYRSVAPVIWAQLEIVCDNHWQIF